MSERALEPIHLSPKPPTAHPKRSPTQTAGGRQNNHPADRQAAPTLLAEREHDYRLIDALAPIDGEVVIHKRSASAFGSTALAAVLNQLGVDTLIVAGESTSGCVRATVVDGRDLRYTVVVPEECVFDRTEASHAINLYDMHREYAHVWLLDETIGYVKSLGSN